MSIKFRSSSLIINPALQKSTFNKKIQLLFFFLLSTCMIMGQANISVSGKNINISNGQTITSNTNNTDFGNKSVCGGIKNHNFTISNSGSSSLIISSITSSNSDFTISAVPASIAPGNSDVISIQFDPSVSGNISSTITIINNDALRDPFNFNIEGTGTSPSADIIRGNSIELDGVDDYVDCGNSINTSIDNLVSFTVEAWIKPDDIQREQEIVSNTVSGVSEGFELKIINGTVLFTYRDNNGQQYSSPGLSISVGEWHHIAGVLTATGISVYSNGIEAGTNHTATGIKPAINSLIIGGNSSFGSFNSEGKIDEVRLWNIARNSSEIRENMHLSLSGCESGLLVYYQFNTGNGGTLYNKLGNGYDGSLQNGASWSTSEINLGNDSGGNSNSETITNIAAGQSYHDFISANLKMNFVRHSGTEDITISYQEFTPNSVSGSNGYNNINNYIWTVNKSTISEDMVVDYIFIFPSNTFTEIISTKYGLYNRPMNSDGEWTKIATSNYITSNSIRFGNIGITGQFMVVQESADGISDVRGNMYNFDGTDNYLSCGSDASLIMDNVFSIECWFKTTIISGTEKVLISKEKSSFDEGYVLSVTDSSINFYFPNMGSLACTGVQLNKWHHVAATFSYGNATLYLDGVAVAASFMEYFANISEALYIGAKHQSPGGGPINYFTGAIDEVGIWSKELSQNEIRENMHLTLRGTETGLISYYQFNSDSTIGTAGGVKDAKNTNNGITYGMTSSDYIASEAAVGGGKSDRITIPGTGPYLANFSNSDVIINFGSATPDGEIVLYRIETEQPHGWNSIAGDVDNEYFIVENFGTNLNFSPIQALTFNRINYISEDDVNSPQASSPLLLYKRGDNDFGATWGNSRGGAETATSGSVGSVGYDTDNNLTSFSQMVIVNINNNSLLPLEIVDFEAKRKNENKVEISWIAQTEEENIEFQIEMMNNDNHEFEKITSLLSKGLAGEETSYNYFHLNSIPVTSYYRIKIIETDGRFSYTETKAVSGIKNTETNNLLLYPNPVNDILRIRFNDLPEGCTTSKIQIADLSGKIIREYDKNTAPYSIIEIGGIRELIPSTYIISVRLNNGEKIIRPFIKI